jgi:TonB family protein
VDVQVDIAPSGSVDRAEVVEACPDASFNWRAVNAVKQWKWKPSTDVRQQTVKLCRP